jgi:DNA-binding protein H-NS
MNLNEIRTNGKWGDAATNINENFSRTNVEIEKMKNRTIRDKGYFSTEALLKAAWPSPVRGDFAWAGSPYPGTVWECGTAETWTNTGVIPDVPSADLNNWSQTDW